MRKIVSIFTVLLMMLVPAIAAGTGPDEGTVPAGVELSLETVRSHAEQFHIVIIDWQHESYRFDPKVLKLDDQGALLAFLKRNLHNWALVTSRTGTASFYLLPLGVPAKDILTKPEFSTKSGQTKAAFALLGKVFESAKPLPGQDILSLKPVLRLTDLVSAERGALMRFNRLVTLADAEPRAYTFDVAYNSAIEKYVPVSRDGQPVAANQLEGFLTPSTVLDYLLANQNELKASQSGGWTFLSRESEPLSYLALNNAEGGLEFAAVSATAERTMLEFHVTGTEQGYACTTIIPTNQGQMVLSDQVTYQRRQN